MSAIAFESSKNKFRITRNARGQLILDDWALGINEKRIITQQEADATIAGENDPIFVTVLIP